MRESLTKLNAAIESKDSDSFLQKFHDSEWLLHVSYIIKAANQIKYLISEKKASVLLHCSDGWDRTPQLSSVSMIMLDSYYRTLRGFEILIEQEWLALGHKFAQRNGHIARDHVDANYGDEERSPIFVQFMDVVYQLITQYPCSFEFNE